MKEKKKEKWNFIKSKKDLPVSEKEVLVALEHKTEKYNIALLTDKCINGNFTKDKDNSFVPIAWRNI